MQHQYGEVLWTYDQIAELTANAKAASLDTLTCSAGGRAAWTAPIRTTTTTSAWAAPRPGGPEYRLAHQAGLRVIPYMNGRLMDVTMPFFQERGKHITAKTISAP
jgi:hypothetical protein